MRAACTTFRPPSGRWLRFWPCRNTLPFYAECSHTANGPSVCRRGRFIVLSHGEEGNPPALVDEIADYTVLIVGYGSIGQAIEARLAPFGPKFLRVARSAREGVEPVSKLDDLLGQADIVVLIIPLTSETSI